MGHKGNIVHENSMKPWQIPTLNVESSTLYWETVDDVHKK